MDILGLTLQTVRVPILRYGAEGGFRAPPLGELMVSLSYQPLMEKLTVIVVRAKNLPIPDDSSSCNPYVKVGETNKKKVTVLNISPNRDPFRSYSRKMGKVSKRRSPVSSGKLRARSGMIFLALMFLTKCFQSVHWSFLYCVLTVS